MRYLKLDKKVFGAGCWAPVHSVVCLLAATVVFCSCGSGEDHYFVPERPVTIVFENSYPDNGCVPYEDAPAVYIDGESYFRVPIPPSFSIPKSDILFVIDNSASMAQKQANLAAQARAFVEALAESGNDFRLGIITTTINDPYNPDQDHPCEAGRLMQVCRNGTPVCQYDAEREKWIKQDCDKYPNVFKAPFPDPKLTGDERVAEKEKLIKELVEGFTATIKVGTKGANIEQGLEAIRRALTAPLTSEDGDNEGFLRSDAGLTIIILSDEDDCSHQAYGRETPLLDSDSLCYGKYQWEITKEQEFVCEYNYDLEDYVEGTGEDVSGVNGRISALVGISEYINIVKGLKKGQRVSVAVIAGDEPEFEANAQGKCVFDDALASICFGGPDIGSARPAIRYIEFAKQAATVDWFTKNPDWLGDSICRDDYAETLLGIAHMVTSGDFIKVGDMDIPCPNLIDVALFDPTGCEDTVQIGCMAEGCDNGGYLWVPEEEGGPGYRFYGKAKELINRGWRLELRISGDLGARHADGSLDCGATYEKFLEECAFHPDDESILCESKDLPEPTVHRPGDDGAPLTAEDPALCGYTEN